MLAHRDHEEEGIINLQTAIRSGGWIERNEHGSHIGIEPTILVPVSIVLMPEVHHSKSIYMLHSEHRHDIPNETTSSACLFHHQLGMVMVHLAAQKLLHPINYLVCSRDETRHVCSHPTRGKKKRKKLSLASIRL